MGREGCDLLDPPCSQPSGDCSLASKALAVGRTARLGLAAPASSSGAGDAEPLASLMVELEPAMCPVS